jgi:hypothetical protein
MLALLKEARLQIQGLNLCRMHEKCCMQFEENLTDSFPTLEGLQAEHLNLSVPMLLYFAGILQLEGAIQLPRPKHQRVHHLRKSKQIEIVHRDHPQMTEALTLDRK